MKLLLEKFSPRICNEKVGDNIFIPQIPPTIPEKVFDIHGYIQEEIPQKINWILEYSKSKNYSRIRIITGVGKNIIFSRTVKVLRKIEEEYRKISITPSTGVIEVFFNE